MAFEAVVTPRVADVARYLAEQGHWLSLAMLVAGTADWEYPSHCYECRQSAMRMTLELLRAAGLKPLVEVQPGPDRLCVALWRGDTPSVVVMCFAHGEIPQVRVFTNVAEAYKWLKRVAGAGARVKTTPALSEYLRRFRIELIGPEEAELVTELRRYATA